jgi:hypothetical protein
MEGDGNTSFFHLMPNGRRRKKSILSLEFGGNNVTVQGQIRGAIYDY